MKPGRCLDRIHRIIAPFDEWQVAVLAESSLTEDLRRDPNLLKRNDLDPSDFSGWKENLVGTYLVRMFAEFEAGLRDYWGNGLNRLTKPPVRDLVDAIASTEKIDEEYLREAHYYRELRNRMVHEEGMIGESEIDLMRVRRALCRFFGFLPPDW